MLEAPPDERNRLGKDRRANRNRNCGDDEQEREVGREAEQSVADGGSGERQQQRRDARLAVDPASQSGGECDSGDRSRGQDSAEQKWAEARLIDEKKHQIRAGHCVREASEHVDDDKRNEERRTVRVRGQEAPRYRGKARQPMLAAKKAAIRRIASNRPGTASSHTRSSNGVSTARTSRSRYRYLPGVEQIADQRRHFDELVLERKVARVEDGTRLPGGRTCKGAPVGRKDIEGADGRAPRTPNARRRFDGRRAMRSWTYAPGSGLAIVSCGSTAAVALGAPLGSVIGAKFGWRAMFAAVGVLALQQ